jgi:5S rRNA maturation endonuclease (ribonuclease M5)
MIPSETPYKVIKYLVKLSDEKTLPKNYESQTLILHFLERGYLTNPGERAKKLSKTYLFDKPFQESINPIFKKYSSFIKKYQIESLENHYTISDFEALILIEVDKAQILSEDYSFQTILTKYFGSSKHRNVNSILSVAIKKILSIDLFPEEDKDQQYLSILYSKNETKFIILCENKNRLKISRHDFIEFWYAGGKNTNQLKFIPKPKFPVFYLFDWDFDGLNIYTDIKRKYLKEIEAFVPDKFASLMEKQEKVKGHYSKWKNKNCFQYLSEGEKGIAEILFKTDSIIEEQKILINNTNLSHNGIH